MYALKGEENKNSFYEPHLCLQNTSESINVKEAGNLFCSTTIVAGRNHWDRI